MTLNTLILGDFIKKISTNPKQNKTIIYKQKQYPKVNNEKDKLKMLLNTTTNNDIELNKEIKID